MFTQEKTIRIESSFSIFSGTIPIDARALRFAASLVSRPTAACIDPT
jgi:hypothetical protein